MVACNGETPGNRRVGTAVANEADLVIVLLHIARSAEPCSTRHYWFYIVKHFSLIARASLSSLACLPACSPHHAPRYLPRHDIHPCIYAGTTASFSYSIGDSVDILMDLVD